VIGLRRLGCGSALCTVLVVATGCGYRMQRPFREDVQTVYVPIFQSREFRRGLEFQLTEALKKRIEQDTPYRLAHRDQADTELIGEILEVRQAVLGNDFRTDLPRELSMLVVVRYHWKDLRSGEVLVERELAPMRVDYIPPVGEDFFEASQESLEDLAERIVESMMSDF
jgi:hypothetical protein